MWLSSHLKYSLLRLLCVVMSWHNVRSTLIIIMIIIRTITTITIITIITTTATTITTASYPEPKMHHRNL